MDRYTQHITVTSEALKVWIQHSCFYKCLDVEADLLWESNSSTGFFFLLLFLKILFWSEVNRVQKQQKYPFWFVCLFFFFILDLFTLLVSNITFCASTNRH